MGARIKMGRVSVHLYPKAVLPGKSTLPRSLTEPAEGGMVLIERLFGFYCSDFTVFRSVKSKIPNTIVFGILVEEGGFEPPKSSTTDLQSAPFGHSGTPPYSIGAGGRTRTPDLLITNQLLYQLSYTSLFAVVVAMSSAAKTTISDVPRFVNSFFQKNEKFFPRVESMGPLPGSPAGTAPLFLRRMRAGTVRIRPVGPGPLRPVPPPGEETRGGCYDLTGDVRGLSGPGPDHPRTHPGTAGA